MAKTEGWLGPSVDARSTQVGSTCFPGMRSPDPASQQACPLTLFLVALCTEDLLTLCTKGLLITALATVEREELIRGQEQEPLSTPTGL